MAWFDATYGYKEKITIQNGQVAGDEVDFPVLVSKTDVDLKDVGNGGHVQHASGWDIIFTNAAETVQLKHEIERYINTTGEIIMHVKLPAISAAVDTDFYMYYGKAGVGANPSTSLTWNANYVGVFHMHDSGAPLNDSSQTGRNWGVSTDPPVWQQTGKIGYAVSFDGDNNGGFYNTVDYGFPPITAETWIKFDTYSGSDQIVLDFRDEFNGILYYDVSETEIKWYISDGGGAKFIQLKDNPDDLVNFHHFVVKVDDDNVTQGYYDGANAGSLAVGTITPLAYGRSAIATKYDFTTALHGDMDEIRFSSAMLSGNWISTSYNTQNDPSTFLAFGGEESQVTECTGSNMYYFDGTDNIELCRDDTSFVQVFDGTEIIGIDTVATTDGDASPIHVFDGTNIKALKKKS